jgi:hypothetical protein
MIFQDYVRFKMSVGINIAIGDIDQRTNHPRVETSAQRSLAEEIGSHKELLALNGRYAELFALQARGYQ